MVLSTARKVLLTACALAFALPAAGQGSFSPAYFMCVRPMTDAAPAADMPAFRLLEQAKMAEAASAFRKRLAAQPEDLAAYLGLLQSEPRVVEGEARARRGSAWTDRAKGALAVYSQWRLAWAGNKGRRGEGQRVIQLMQKVATKLADAWKVKRHLVVGFAMIDLQTDGGDPLGPRRRMMNELIGSAATEVYRKGMLSWGKAAPPAQRLTPKQNRRPLRGLLVLEMLQHTRHPTHELTRNGKFVRLVEDPIPPREQAMARYYQKWIALLDKDLGDKAFVPNASVWPPPKARR